MIGRENRSNCISTATHIISEIDYGVPFTVTANGGCAVTGTYTVTITINNSIKKALKYSQSLFAI